MRCFDVVPVDTYSPEWLQARVGRLTSSGADDAFAVLRAGGESARRRAERYRLVAERLTGRPTQASFDGDFGLMPAALRRGLELEPQALAAYAAVTGYDVRPRGFCARSDCQAGATPDAVVGDFEGLVEIKCPQLATHIGGVLVDGSTVERHRVQLEMLLWVTGAPWIDVVSFAPEMPAGLRMYSHRLEYRDLNPGFEQAILGFLAEVDEAVHRCLARGNNRERS